MQAIADRVRGMRADVPQGTALRFVPILGPSEAEPAYRLLDGETLGQVKITEVSEGGVVAQLLVHNMLDTRVYLMDGQELVGAKQNRILNTDVLVPAASKLTIPVSCVEQGRWARVSKTFSPGKAASYRTRAGKSQRVHESVRERGQHDADQSAVWGEVQYSLRLSDAASPTDALSDAYARREGELEKLRRTLRQPAEAVGLAAFRGAAFLGLDLFDRGSTLAAFWSSLVDSYALEIDMSVSDALPEGQAAADRSQIAHVLKRVGAGAWEPFAAPGEGRDWRLVDEAYTGSALVWEERKVVHLQVFPKPVRATPRGPRVHRPYGPVD